MFKTTFIFYMIFKKELWHCLVSSQDLKNESLIWADYDEWEAFTVYSGYLDAILLCTVLLISFLLHCYNSGFLLSIAGSLKTKCSSLWLVLSLLNPQIFLYLVFSSRVLANNFAYLCIHPIHSLPAFLFNRHICLSAYILSQLVWTTSY